MYQRNSGCLGQTDWRTDGRTDTGPFYRPCSAYYAHSVKSPMLSLTEFSAKILSALDPYRWAI